MPFVIPVHAGEDISDTKPEHCTDEEWKFTYRARIQRISEQCPARINKENTFSQIREQMGGSNTSESGTLFRS
jgi:hypothetical protein